MWVSIGCGYESYSFNGSYITATMRLCQVKKLCNQWVIGGSYTTIAMNTIS